MNTKLKFLVMLFTIVVGGVNSAWAQNETYYFETWGSESSPTVDYGDSYPNSEGLTANYLNSITTGSGTHNLYVSAKRFASRIWTLGKKRGWTIESGGLRCYGQPNYAPELAICGLWNGDRVKITFTNSEGNGIQFVKSGSAKVNGSFVTAGDDLTSGVEFSAVSNGDIILKGKSNYTYITKVEIYYQYGSPAISFVDTEGQPKPTSMKVGEEMMAYTTVTPSTSTPTFTSSNASVATIDRYGYIRAVGVGTTTITASLTVGNQTTVSESYTLTVVSAASVTYTQDFTGCVNASTLELIDVSGKPYKKIDFTNKRYGEKTFNLLDFFALKSDETLEGDKRVFLHNGGIYNYQDHSTPFYVTGLHNGDKITINYFKYYDNYGMEATSTNINTTSITSGTEYKITEDGDLVLSMGKYNRISSIVIVHDWDDNPSFTWSDANLTNKFDTSTGGKLLRYKITDMNFTEPTAVKVPADATHTVRSLNQNVAIMDVHNFGDVLFVNTGTVNIQGTLKTNGTDYRDTYTVDVWADVAEFTDVNNRYEVTGIGKLQEKEVTAVRGLKMNFGSDDDATLVLKDATYNTYVAYTINKLNGWRHRDAGAQSTIPEHGSFYKFKALTSGKLRFGGVKNGDNNTVVLMDAGNGATEAISGSPLFQIASDQRGVKGTSDLSPNDYVQLTAGHTYYLFGNVPTDGAYNNETWSAYMLTWFSYESDFKLVNTINNVETEVNYGAAPRTDNNNITSVSNFVTVKGDTNPTVTIVGSSGDIRTTGARVDIAKSGSNTILSVSGLSGTGGSIRFRVTSSGGGNAYFNLTIPYATHSWDFRTGTESGENGQSRSALATEIKTNGENSTLGLSGITRVYRSSSKNDSGVWEHIGDPLLAANGNVEGDNGFFIGKTSGLIFVTGAKSFGALETECTWQKPIYTTNAETGEVTITGYTPTTEDSYTIEHGLTEVDDETEYYFGPEVTNKAEYVYMKTGSKIIFPGVRPGQYIKIYTRRLSNLGDHWRAEHLVDLEDKPYTASDEIAYFGINEDRNSVNDTPHAWAGDNIKGSAMFKVPTNYDKNNTDISLMPSLTVTNGWVRIYKIELLDEYKTDLYLSVNNQNTEIKEFYKVEPNSEYASIAVYKKNGAVIPNAAAYTYKYEGTVGKIGATHAHTCDYDVEPDGNVDVTIIRDTTKSGGNNYHNVILQYNGGNGLVKIIQKEYGDDTGKASRAEQHIINKRETYIAVSEVNVQSYPYTWDFTNYNMYQGSSPTTATKLGNATGTGYGSWTQPTAGVNTFQVNNSASVNTSMKQENISNDSYEQVTKPLFAQGGQLSAGSTAIAEVQGLGVSRPYGANGTMYTWKTGDDGFGRYGYSYKTYDLTSSVTIDGSTLAGAGIITIPQVDNGMYVFVKASAEPSSVSGATEPATDPFSVKTGVYLYQNNSGSTQDVVITFDDPSTTTIEIVAVTNIVKAIGPTGYATESRDCAIDHSYQSKLTNHPVYAYGIDGYDGTYNYNGYPEVKKSWFSLNTVPAKNGVLLFENQTTHDANGFNSPLFIPAVNNTSLPQYQLDYLRNDNWLAPSVNWNSTNKLCSEGVHFYNTDTTIKKHKAKSGDDVDNDVYCEKFILTNVYYTYYKKDGHVTGEHTASTVGFYRLKVTGGGAAEDYLGGNKAYLLVPKANLPLALWNGGNGEGVAGRAREGVIYIDLENFEDDDATVVDNTIVNKSTDGNIFYTISGIRINGRPTAKGIYICNGRKVSIK